MFRFHSFNVNFSSTAEVATAVLLASAIVVSFFA